MTEITKLLDDKAKRDFESLMYGEDGMGGLTDSLPVGLTFDDIGVECICCLMILKQQYRLSGLSNNKLCRLYAATMDYISVEHQDIKTSGSIFTPPYFAKFVNAYPQIKTALS